METIKYIKTHGIESLKNDLGIVVKEYPAHDLIVLNYSQIDSPKLDPVVGECRGLILNKRTLDVVSRSFDRFFNYGENGVGVGESLEGCAVYEKRDGSLIKIYKYRDMWHISTRGTAFAESDCNGHGDFRGLVLSAMRGGRGCAEKEFQEDANFHLDPEMTYIFEFTSPENRVVTPYTTRGLTLLATRHNKTGIYGTAYDDLCAMFFAECEKAARYSFNSIGELVEASSTLTGLKEGFVVYRDGIPWFKCKSPLYVKAHHIRGEGLTKNRIIELVVSGEDDEYLTYFPDDAILIKPHKECYKLLLEDIVGCYERIKHIQDQRDFARAATQHSFSSCLFTARKLGISPLDAFHASQNHYKLRIMKSCMGD